MITLRWMSSVWSKWFKEESYILFILAWPMVSNSASLVCITAGSVALGVWRYCYHVWAGRGE